MWSTVIGDTKHPTDYQLRRVTVDLTREDIRQESVQCQDLDDFLGGIARSFKLLAHYEVQDAFAPSAPLIMNLGVFSGTDLMTGLRIFFSAYSPLKVANNGRPLAMWSAASDKFGTKVRAAGVDEVIFLGRAQQPIVHGLSFGDFHASCRVIEQAAAGQLPEVGQGVKRLSEKLGETAYAMHCKGLELPAYLPETNPGYPFAIAGGHMSMRTFLLLVFDGKTDMNYWVDAIVNKGPYYTRDDILGLCKFAGAPDKVIEPVFKDFYGVEVTREDLVHATQCTYLRGLLLERKQGATLDDYVLPTRVYQRNPNVQLPHFITPEFWRELRQRVFQAFDAQIEGYGLRPAA